MRKTPVSVDSGTCLKIEAQKGKGPLLRAGPEDLLESTMRTESIRGVPFRVPTASGTVDIEELTCFPGPRLTHIGVVRFFSGALAALFANTRGAIRLRSRDTAFPNYSGSIQSRSGLTPERVTLRHELGSAAGRRRMSALIRSPGNANLRSVGNEQGVESPLLRQWGCTVLAEACVHIVAF
jgi:hypothetical protein